MLEEFSDMIDISDTTEISSIDMNILQKVSWKSLQIRENGAFMEGGDRGF